MASIQFAVEIYSLSAQVYYAPWGLPVSSLASLLALIEQLYVTVFAFLPCVNAKVDVYSMRNSSHLKANTLVPCSTWASNDCLSRLDSAEWKLTDFSHWWYGRTYICLYPLQHYLCNMIRARFNRLFPATIYSWPPSVERVHCGLGLALALGCVGWHSVVAYPPANYSCRRPRLAPRLLSSDRKLCSVFVAERKQEFRLF